MKTHYKSIKVKPDTYKKIKLLAVELDMPITRLIDRLYEKRKLSQFKAKE